MDNNIDGLRRLIESIKTVGFWGRLFSWRKIRSQLVDASADLQKLIGQNETLYQRCTDLEEIEYKLRADFQQKRDELIRNEGEINALNITLKDFNGKISKFNSDIATANEKIHSQETQYNNLSQDQRILNERNSQLLVDIKRLTELSGTNSQTITDLNQRKTELDLELAGIKKDLQISQDELSEVKKINTELLKDEEFRKNEHSNAVSSLTTIQKQIHEDRTNELEEKANIEMNRLRSLKETWSKHQEQAKNLIKSICQKYTIEYLEKVPFKGDPDNTLLICDEYIVFDAKSPGSDDLSNFPNYLKDQAEKAIKYAKQENVKSDVFFIVPSNTLESLDIFVYRHGEHNVYIISADALEPVILGLKKIEEYEFAKELSPEDRENICRILGRFAHLSKRRIQVDSFFAKQFIELAYKCETNLPKDLLESILEFEKAEKLNPPQEKRVKAIPIKELEKENLAINQAAEGRGILMEGDGISIKLNETPLYK